MGMLGGVGGFVTVESEAKQETVNTRASLPAQAYLANEEKSGNFAIFKYLLVYDRIISVTNCNL